MDRVNTIFITASTISGNFIYQLFGQGDWETAIERSYFMAAMALILFICLRNKKEVADSATTS